MCSSLLWVWWAGFTSGGREKEINRTSLLRIACMCLHRTAVVRARSPGSVHRAHGRHMSGQAPWVPGPASNQRRVMRSLAGSVGQWRAPLPGREPMGCAQNVGTWICAHVVARKAEREGASGVTRRSRRAESGCWETRRWSGFGLSTDGPEDGHRRFV